MHHFIFELSQKAKHQSTERFPETQKVASSALAHPRERKSARARARASIRLKAIAGAGWAY